MKTKQEILTALAHSGDDKLLLAGLLDKEQTCEQRGYLTHTKFLDLKQRALCTDAVRLAGGTGHALFWGGYEDAERGIYLFYPDYMDAESAKMSAPLALLRARKRREDTLTHRDYLGSLMGLQIDRSVVGDILVHEEGADIIVLEDMAEFILMHFAKAGRKHAAYRVHNRRVEAVLKEHCAAFKQPGAVFVRRLAVGGRQVYITAPAYIEAMAVLTNHALRGQRKGSAAQGAAHKRKLGPKPRG